MPKDQKQKNSGLGGVVRLSSEQMQTFREISDKFGWTDAALGNRLVEFFAALKVKTQQVLLGMPVTSNEVEDAIADLIDVAHQFKREDAEPAKSKK
jgi:hypothetical protein